MHQSVIFPMRVARFHYSVDRPYMLIRLVETGWILVGYKIATMVVSKMKQVLYTISLFQK